MNKYLDGLWNVFLLTFFFSGIIVVLYGVSLALGGGGDYIHKNHCKKYLELKERGKNGN